jgi:hypothetical protein
MLENPQPSIPEVSCRQNSPAAAGLAIATKAIANSAVAGAAVSLKNCFILFFPVSDFGPPQSTWDRDDVCAIDAKK